jgi:hypothetical protein
MTTSVDDILNGPDYFYCEHYKARMKKSCCIQRQAYRDDVKVRQNPNTPLAPNLVADGCTNCAQGAQIREEMNMPSKKGICMNCGKERSLPANDKCWKCNGYGQQKKSGEKKQKPVPAEMPPEKVKRLEDIKENLRARHRAAFACDPLPIAKIEGQAATLLSPDPRIVLLDFTLPENADLYEPWLKYGRSHRRGPGDQAMMAVEQILFKEGLL